MDAVSRLAADLGVARGVIAKGKYATATTAKRAERAHLTEMLVHEARSTLNRFTGGGFNLNMTAG